MKDLIRFYFAVIVIPIGIASDILALIIFVRKKLNHNSIFGFLYAWLCIFNVLSLANESFFAILENYDIDLISYSNLTCKTLYGWVKYVNHLPSFQMILIAFYLYLSIAFPSLKQKIHKYKFMLIFSMILFVTIVNCVYVVYEKKLIENQQIESSNISNQNNSSTYISECKTEFILDFSLDWLNLAMRDLIPFFMIFILNFLTMRSLYKSKAAVNSQVKKKEQSFVVSIFVANFTFLGIYLPWSIIFIIYHLNDSFFLFPALIETNTFEIVASVFSCIGFLNNMICFFSNFLFNYLFFEEFLYLFCNQKKVVWPTGVGIGIGSTTGR